MSTSSWVRDTLEGRSGPRRPALSVLAWVGIGVCGVIALAYGILAGLVGGGGIGAFLLGLLFATLPVPLLIFAVLSLDRLEPEPTRNLVLTFAWGAAVSVALALGLQIAISFIFPSERFGLVIAAPVTEELAKGLIIFLILHLKKTELDGPTDGLVYAGMVGLGFAFSENIVYYGQAFGDGAGSLVGTFVLRGIFSPLAHPLFTAATGVALGYAALKRDKAIRWLLPIGGLLLAMILHGLWNGSSSSPLGIFALAAFYFLIMVPVLVGCILIAYFDRRRILKQISVYLPAYVPAGIFNRDEVQLLGTMKARRKMRHLMRDYQQAATELAMLDDHAARGTAGAEYGPRREALVRILMLAKQAFPGNDGVAANLAQVEGTLPPPPLPRPAGPYGPHHGGPPQVQHQGYGPRPGFGPPQGYGPPQGPRPVPPPGAQGPPPGGQGPPPGALGPPPGRQAPPPGGYGPAFGGQGPPAEVVGPPQGGYGPRPGAQPPARDGQPADRFQGRDAVPAQPEPRDAVPAGEPDTQPGERRPLADGPEPTDAGWQGRQPPS